MDKFVVQNASNKKKLPQKVVGCFFGDRMCHLNLSFYAFAKA